MDQPQRNIIVIGSSAGGFSTLPKLTSQLPEGFPASVFIVQHLGPGVSPRPLLDKLKKESKLIVKIPDHGENIKNGHIYVAPPDHHMLVKKSEILVVRGPRENRYRPSVDMLFRSAAAHFKSKVIGIVMTGMLDDGTSGIEAIKKSGGISIVQDPENAEWPDMPQSALRNAKIDFHAPAEEIGKLLEKLIYEPVNENLQPPPTILIEAEIAERYITGIENVYKIGRQIPVSCPECGGSLWEIKEGDLPHFRCHVGHTFNESGLLISQAKGMEETLWVSLRMMEERVHMLASMREKEKNDSITSQLSERIEEVKVHISRIRNILHSNEIFRSDPNQKLDFG
jgi:two-component system, chemotaxis family, protein-glutamate methylesterase/glutaminase